MDPKSIKTVENFTRAFEKAACIIREQNPDCIVAPMMGAVPFIDVLNIVDPDFPNYKVEYVPASSTVHKVREALRGAFEQLIADYIPHGGKLLALDEVVSGSSMERVYKQFEAARMTYANKSAAETFGNDADFTTKAVQSYRDQLKDDIVYHTIGIVEKRNPSPLNPLYFKMLHEGIVIPVETKCIITMDKSAFIPATYRRETDGQGHSVPLPVIEGFNITPEYLELLNNVAQLVGRDPGDVTVRNTSKIRDSYKRVPEHLRTLGTAA